MGLDDHFDLDAVVDRVLAQLVEEHGEDWVVERSDRLQAAFGRAVETALTDARPLVEDLKAAAPEMLEERRRGRREYGYEVDLVGVRADQLVLATVKSFFGSRGVVAEHVTGETSDVRARKLYALLNDSTIREEVLRGAADRFGYAPDQVELRL